MSMFVDWQKAMTEKIESNEPEWEFVGQETMREYFIENPKALEQYGYIPETEADKEDNAIEASESAGFPIYNYAYPLDKEPSAEEIIKVCLGTNCTVVKNLNEDAYYLALTGCGMDLSQDICKAYLLAGNNIPIEWAHKVCEQDGLTQSGDSFIKIIEECQKTLDRELKHGEYRYNQLSDVLAEARKKKEETLAKAIKESGLSVKEFIKKNTGVEENDINRHYY